jgi:hypothetical protein
MQQALKSLESHCYCPTQIGQSWEHQQLSGKTDSGNNRAKFGGTMKILQNMLGLVGVLAMLGALFLLFWINLCYNAFNIGNL